MGTTLDESFSSLAGKPPKAGLSTDAPSSFSVDHHFDPSVAADADEAEEGGGLDCDEKPASDDEGVEEAEGGGVGRLGALGA